MTENKRLTLKSVNGDVWLLDSEEKPYLLSVDGDDYNKALNRLADYEAIGTVEEFKELKEKNEPKKPDYEGDGYADGKLTYDYAKCPICGHDFEYGINDWEAEYCSDCGQKLDWSE